MEETRKHKKWRQDKQPDQVSFIECRVMPYIGWQGKRLGQGGDRGPGLLKLHSRMRRGFVLFPGTGSRLRPGLHIFLGGKMFARARERLARAGKVVAREQFWRAREKLRRAREKLRRAREKLWARAGRVYK